MLCVVCREGVANTNDLVIHEGQPIHAACLRQRLVEQRRKGRPLTHHQAALKFLSEHPGQAFCAECIAAALSIAARTVYLAMLKIEGAGTRRTHGLCSSCGKDRLVSVVTAERSF